MYYIVNAINVAACEKMYTNILNKGGDETHYSVECIKSIASKYLPCRTMMTLVNSNMNVHDLIKAISNGNCYSLIIKSFEETDWLIWTDVYIISSRDKYEFISGLLRLRRNLMWNPRAKFIINIQDLKVDDISALFNTFSNNKIYNVVLLGNKYDNTIYTYYPFSNGACNEDLQNPVLLGHCKDIENISKIFKNDVPDIIDNCTFKVVASEDIPNFIFETSNFTVFGEHVLGIEQYLLSIIAENENVKFKFILKPQNYTYGFVLQNGTATGLLQYVQDGEADIAAGGFVLVKNRIETFDYIWGLNYGIHKIFTPTNAEIIWDDVYKEFNSATWVLIFLIYCLILIIFILKRSTMSKTHQNRTYLALRLWGYLCGNPSSKLSKEKSMRILFVWWILFTFFVVNFYTTTMFSLITRRVHVKSNLNPDKLEELPYNPCIANETRLFISFVYNKTLPMNANNEFCEDSETTLDFIVSRKDLYTVNMEYAYLLNEYKYIDEEGFSKLDLVEFYHQHTTAFYFNRGFPYIDKISKYLRRISEAGLLKKQLQNILQHGQIVRHRRKKKFRTINIPDIVLHFFFLLGGYALSLVVFFIEIILQRKIMRK